MGSKTDPGSEKLSCIEKWAKYPVFVGLLVGILAAAVQGLLISAGGPEAYGFCVACHTRDLVNGVVNAAAGTSLAVAAISKNAIFPIMTVAGVIIGAFGGAKVHGEFRIKKGNFISYAWYTAGGILFMIFALVMGGCPYRMALRTGYGDIIAFISIIGIIAGVFVGTKIAIRITECEG
jgi:FtsH-binding integral membrane protein